MTFLHSSKDYCQLIIQDTVNSNCPFLNIIFITLNEGYDANYLPIFGIIGDVSWRYDYNKYNHNNPIENYTPYFTPIMIIFH